MNQGTRLDSDNLRIEIAILKEKIHAFIPEYGKFNIPAIMESKGVKNASNEDNDFIWLYVPYEYTFAWGNEWIPAGTRFVVADIGGNVNDIRIIGRYDRNREVENPSHKLAQYIIDLIMLKAREQAIFDFCYSNDNRIKCHHARRPIHDDVGNMVPNNYPHLDYGLFEGPDIDDSNSHEYNKTMNT